jgi:hypothetical protein
VSEGGVVDLTFHSNAKTLLGFDQRIGVVWANLDSGRHR